MSDLIDRQAAIAAVEFGITYAEAINKETGEVKELFQEGNDELRKAVDRIKQLPSAQPKCKTGRWIRHAIGHKNTPWGFDCSVCNKWFVIGEETANQYNYCPNCGAKMEEKTE